MKRPLLPSRAFLRAARIWAKRHPETTDDLQRTLEMLADDAFSPSLRKHKLKGKLAGSLASSAGYRGRAR